MFFSWYIKNKSFKKGSNLGGQITPFLLVVLVILLSAAIATINIGRTSIDKTYSANSADAGALAGASGMAGVMNYLAEANDSLRQNYDAFYEGQMLPVFETADDAWMEIQQYSLAAMALIAAMTVTVLSIQGWAACAAAAAYALLAALTAAAMILIYQAIQQTVRFNTAIGVLMNFLEQFYENQLQAYCDIRKNADEACTGAGETANSLAFSNSGISQKLSDSQQSSFSSFMTSPSGSFSWQDKANAAHTVSVNVDIPSLDNYILQHTKDPYKTVRDHLQEALDASQRVLTLYNSIFITLGVLLVTYIVLFVLSLSWLSCCAAWPCCATTGNAICGLIEALVGYTGSATLWISALLLALLVIGVGWGYATIYNLKYHLDKAWEGIGVGGTRSSSACGDAADLLIVQIASVPYPGDVGVTSTQEHPGTSSGIIPTSYPKVTSSATASFDGGDVGSFDASYDSSLTSAS